MLLTFIAWEITRKFLSTWERVGFMRLGMVQDGASETWEALPQNKNPALLHLLYSGGQVSQNFI
jgi:hypothetical protein